jgi:hypothetical protein
MGCDVFGRCWHIAPVLTVALKLCGCSSFASYPPPMDIGSDAAARSLKDAWTPTVAVTRVGATTMRKPRLPYAPAQPQTAATCTSDSECVMILAALINDPMRRWIGQPQTAAEYANGTRFFAYRAMRTRLSCRELKRAMGDTNVAAARLQAPAPGVSAAQAARALSLATAVGIELRGEIIARCRATPPHSQARNSWVPSSELAT